MSKRLDILGARIFGASVCHARKSPRLSRKCPNVWTKSYNLAIMHKHKPYIPSTYACICAFCYFVNFLHTFLDIFNIFKNILKSIIFGIFKTDKGMGKGDAEGIWDAPMGEMTRWVLHMGRWISLERTSWRGDHRFGCL